MAIICHVHLDLGSALMYTMYVLYQIYFSDLLSRRWAFFWSDLNLVYVYMYILVCRFLQALAGAVSTQASIVH